MAKKTNEETYTMRAQVDASKFRDDQNATGKNGGKGRRNNKRRSKSGGSKGAQDMKNVAKTTYPAEVRNDFAWYNANPALIEAAARIPFTNFPGTQIRVPNARLKNTSGSFTATGLNYQVPGVLEIDWVPSLGQSWDNTSGASLAAKEMYAKVREKFSGNLDEDAPDIMIYVMALDSVFSYIEWLKRVYRTINMYSPANYLMPDAFMHAYGLNDATIANLRAQKMELYGYINQLIAMANKFTVPKVMNIVTRHAWMNQNIYGDANSPSAQFYVFNQTHFYVFDETGEPSSLSLMLLDPKGKTAAQLFEFGRNMFEKLAGSADAYTINGHLMRAFEGSEMVQVAPLTLEEVQIASYVPLVNLQIHNLRCFGSLVPTSFKITQDPATNAIIHKPALGPLLGGMYTSVHPMADTASIVDIVGEPTAEVVTEATRLCASVETIAGSEYLSIGTEYVWNMTLIERGPDALGWATTNFSSYVNLASKGVDGATEDALRADLLYIEEEMLPSLLNFLKGAMAFEMFPITSMVNFDGSAYTVEPILELNNAANIQSWDMSRLHEVCVLSEFNAYGIK